MFGEKSKLQMAFEDRHVEYFDQTGTIKLVEEEANNGLDTAYIHDVCSGSVLFGFHEAEPINSLIKVNRAAGYYKKCDYALFTMVSGCPTVFLIEMKSTNFDVHQITCQLKSAACMVDYITGFAKRFLNVGNSIFKERFVVFGRSKTQSGRLPTPSATRLPFSGTNPNTEPEHAKLLLDPDVREYSVLDLIRN